MNFKVISSPPSPLLLKHTQNYCRCTSDEVAASLPLEVTLSSGAEDCIVTVEPATEGRLRCTYNAQRTGYYRLDATCWGTQLAGSPFSVLVSSDYDYLLA